MLPRTDPRGNSRMDVVFSANTLAFPQMFTSVVNIYSFSISATTVRLLIKSYLKTLCQRPWRRIYVVSEK
jgi:hypothetical protein